MDHETINNGINMVDVDVTHRFGLRSSNHSHCVFLKNLDCDNSKLAVHNFQCHSGGRNYACFNDPAHESTPDRKKLRLSRGNVDTAWLILGISGVCIRPGNITGAVNKGWSLNGTWVGELNHDPARIRSGRIEPHGKCSGLGFDSSSLEHSSPCPCEYEISNWESRCFTVDIDGIAISVKFVGRITWGIEFTVKKGILMSGGALLKKCSIFSVLNLTDVIHSENIFYFLAMGCVYTRGYNKRTTRGVSTKANKQTVINVAWRKESSQVQESHFCRIISLKDRYENPCGKNRKELPVTSLTKG